MVKHMINLMITDSVAASIAALAKANPGSVDDVRNLKENLVCRGDEALRKESRIKQFLLEKVYRHHKLARMADKAERIITTLFEVYIKSPEQLPPNFQVRLHDEGKYVVVADYVAGMTDRYAATEYKKMIDPFELI